MVSRTSTSCRSSKRCLVLVQTSTKRIIRPATTPSMKFCDAMARNHARATATSGHQRLRGSLNTSPQAFQSHIQTERADGGSSKAEHNHDGIPQRPVVIQKRKIERVKSV